MRTARDRRSSGGLRAAGNVAIVNAHNLELRSIVNLAPPAPFNPMTCGPVVRRPIPAGAPCMV